MRKDMHKDLLSSNLNVYAGVPQGSVIWTSLNLYNINLSDVAENSFL